MIISRIIGGLGNQLFQYAAGKALALQHQTELQLDVNAFDKYDTRNFDLAAFQTELHFATKEQVDGFKNRNITGKIRDNIFPMAFRKVYKPKHFHFHPRFFRAPAHIYLHGYWQSEKYFAPVSEAIRREFTMKEEYLKPVQAVAATIHSSPSVSVHIRRGDYKNPATVEIHGVLEANYYRAGIKRVLEKVPDASVYFFSDDMNWVRENLPFEKAIYVSGNLSQNHFEDFYLMSQCQHNIIANSSFSWWAAWLNNNPGKIVIAPKNWFNKGPKDTQDLIPEGWLKI